MDWNNSVLPMKTYRLQPILSFSGYDELFRPFFGEKKIEEINIKCNDLRRWDLFESEKNWQPLSKKSKFKKEFWWDLSFDSHTKFKFLWDPEFEKKLKLKKNSDAEFDQLSRRRLLWLETMQGRHNRNKRWLIVKDYHDHHNYGENHDLDD